MEENNQSFFYFMKCKNATQMPKNNCKVYEEVTVINQTSQKGFVNFHVVNFLLNNTL